MSLKIFFLFNFFFLITFVLSADQTFPSGLEAHEGKQWVEIYGDFTNVAQRFGQSPYRSLIHQVSLSLLEKSDSLWLPEEDGWLTAVLIDRRLVEKLRRGELPANAYIRDLGGVYRLFYRGIDIQFSFEPAPAEILDLVRRVYKKLPRDAEAVLEYYRRHYVIRIYRVENVFNAKQSEENFSGADFSEALLSATLIGNRYQPLWGIHDGFNLLARITPE